MPKVRTKQRGVVDLQLASMVIAMRLPVMALECFAGKTKGPETTRAVSEKVAAIMDGTVSAQLSMMYSTTTFWFDVMTGKSPSGLMTQAVNKATEAALKPGRKTLRANYKRLVPAA
ncbi:hypothetical protein N8E89_26115 (plasmid) [Phyllobacterium sp. A18/5-2]|uniref:hypothetical protein n=1 Tax=Phyllobacterium sp. A18/5-2 TaxID=2978392 RepID=UPI0021C8145F|nr:hypothetical protein [Phyllobacterium sp. A18/5-2]UXN66566.1 hypothetical protein N8E89_26115 [Phyllobacterium sp. A18/5-2]